MSGIVGINRRIAENHSRMLLGVDHATTQATTRARELARGDPNLLEEFLADVAGMRAQLLADAGLHDAPARMQ